MSFIERRTGITALMWDRIGPIYDAILAHPFIRGLTSGALDRSAFRFYAVQDALYLREYARSLSLAAARAPEDDDILMFNEHSKGCLIVERAMHKDFFRTFGLSPEEVRRTPLAPTNQAYTSYLIAVAYDRPFHELIAAVLPCYWIYWEVGLALVAKGSPDPLYQKWIDTYSDEAFGKNVEDVLDLADRLGAFLSEAQQEAMLRHFVTTSRYEWMFWDMGFRQEAWPV
ncbi:MAG: thiaminase II [candidate division Zixibacteria bacterium]|nr:thiaminase II [candidate division Zixibacteria bacterium]